MIALVIHLLSPTFSLASKITPLSTVRNSALSLVLSAFDYSYYHGLLLPALAELLWLLCQCVRVCIGFLDLFLGAVCLSPPDCNPVIVGSIFGNLSLGVCVSGGQCAFLYVCMRSVIYQCLTTVSLSRTILRIHPTPGKRPELCRCWIQISVPSPTPGEANKSRAEGIGLHIQQRDPAINSLQQQTCLCEAVVRCSKRV